MASMQVINKNGVHYWKSITDIQSSSFHGKARHNKQTSLSVYWTRVLTGHWVHEWLPLHHSCDEKQQKQSREYCWFSRLLWEAQISQMSSPDLSYYSWQEYRWHVHEQLLCHRWHYDSVDCDVLGCGFDVDCDSDCDYCSMNLVFFPYLHTTTIVSQTLTFNPLSVSNSKG